jgi:hypothetical protein
MMMTRKYDTVDPVESKAIATMYGLITERVVQEHPDHMIQTIVLSGTRDAHIAFSRHEGYDFDERD